MYVCTGVKQTLLSSLLRAFVYVCVYVFLPPTAIATVTGVKLTFLFVFKLHGTVTLES